MIFPSFLAKKHHRLLDLKFGLVEHLAEKKQIVWFKVEEISASGHVQRLTKTRTYLSRSKSESCNVNAFHGWRNTFLAYL